MIQTIEQIENLSFPSIKLSKLSSIEVMLPDQEEMLREVQILNVIEEQNELCKEQMGKFDQLIISRFVCVLASQRFTLTGVSFE